MLDTEPDLDRKLRALYDHIKTQDPPARLALITAPASRSRYKVLSRLVAIAAVAAIAAAVGLFAAELSNRRATTSPTPTTHPVSRPSPESTPAPTLVPGFTEQRAGTHALRVIGMGDYPTYTVVLPPSWFDNRGYFIDKYPDIGVPRPVLSLSVWDVGEVVRDPCHWQGQLFDPGPSVANLVAALVAQTTRNATTPTDVTLAGYTGKYLEWSVPADMKSSTWTEFDACDLSYDGADRDFVNWFGKGLYQDDNELVPGQVDQLWVLDVKGQRLVVDATYSPDTSESDRAALVAVVDSLRFIAP
jgi:hypothetical protein